MADVKEALAKKLSGENVAQKPGFKMVRLLRAEEIECRISTINEKGLSLLLYKDARVDQRILDETFSPFGWRRSHQSIDGNLYCSVEVWDDEKQQWISKQDVGTMSYSEKEKGQASDSFKRACFNWGIGRELYTAPFIWLPADKVRIFQKGDKYMTTEHFYVQQIEYNGNREICFLEIRNSHGQTVFSQRDVSSSTEQAVVTDQKRADLMKELERTGVTMDAVLQRYKLASYEEMTPAIYDKAMSSLKKSKSKIAA